MGHPRRLRATGIIVAAGHPVRARPIDIYPPPAHNPPMQMQDCLFCRMNRGEIPVEKIAQNEHAFAIRDINPRAPTHCLVIPKAHVDSAREFEWNHAELLAGLFMLAKDVARVEGVWESGYRLAFNVGDVAGMTVHHLHLHLLGGRVLGPEG